MFSGDYAEEEEDRGLPEQDLRADFENHEAVHQRESEGQSTVIVHEKLIENGLNDHDVGSDEVFTKHSSQPELEGQSEVGCPVGDFWKLCVRSMLMLLSFTGLGSFTTRKHEVVGKDNKEKLVLYIYIWSASSLGILSGHEDDVGLHTRVCQLYCVCNQC